MEKTAPIILRVHGYDDLSPRVHIPKKFGFEDGDYVVLRLIDNDQMMSILGATR